ncbi:hypothetical protein HOLleu_33493 [Holothuria leucospilota]|uniref:Uncharacterized protein n=1 Tax=Holothuria leucospilota TaxID=206669 RepID=A0A9Q0YQU7_HOLLE|nr:hypothetical protein HOLleu_33493 [Holothuria leucospilota]
MQIPQNTENPFSGFKVFNLIFISVSFTDITPSSFSSASVEYVLDEDTNVTYSVTISNDGGTAIAAASSGNNFAISFVASSSSDPTSATSVLSLTTDTTSSTNLGAAISAGGTVVISDVIVTVSIPSGSCTDYSYICVQISVVDGAGYTDSDSTNNYHCLTFGDVSDGYAGIYQCADMEVISLLVTAYESSTISLDVDNIFTYSVTIQNSGNFDIEGAVSGNNYALSFALSNSTDLNAADAGTSAYDAETSSATNLGSGIVSGGSVSINNVNAYVNIATADCETYDYVCVVLTKASGANFTDTDTTNNYFCLAFGDPSEGYAGILTCSGKF